VAERTEVITLQDEEGHSHEFALVDVLDVGEHRYAILQPAGGDSAVVFRMEDETLIPIDDDAEFDRVVGALETSDEYDAITRLEDDRPVRSQEGKPGASG